MTVKYINFIVKSICIISIYYFINQFINKKTESFFVKVEQELKKQYKCFLQPKQLYIYKFNSSIQELKKILEKHSIQYIVSAINQIYLCTKNSTDFEIRINKLNNYYLIQFTPIVGDLTKLINLITK